MNEADAEAGLTRRELLKKASPLGRVTMVAKTCTTCGTCTVECGTGALSLVLDEGEGVCRLLFRHDLCIACGKCAKACPEQCLRSERTLEIDKLGGTEEVLFEGEVVKCRGCGKPFASRAMLEGMKTKLGITGQDDGAYLELCPACKTGIRLTGAER